MADSAAFVPIRELSDMLRSRRVSPVEVAEHFIERLESLGPRYNAVVTVTRDRALRQARQAVRRSLRERPGVVRDASSGSGSDRYGK